MDAVGAINIPFFYSFKAACATNLASDLMDTRACGFYRNTPTAESYYTNELARVRVVLKKGAAQEGIVLHVF